MKVNCGGGGEDRGWLGSPPLPGISIPLLRVLKEAGREADLALHPIPTPYSLQQVVSWGAEPIKSELDLIALLMGKPHFSIDRGFCSPQRAASN